MSDRDNSINVDLAQASIDSCYACVSGGAHCNSHIDHAYTTTIKSDCASWIPLSLDREWPVYGGQPPIEQLFLETVS